MRPADLKFPYTGNERHIFLHDHVWFIPARVITKDFSFPGWSHADIFGNDHPINIEYCSGNGAWIAEKALNNPHINWVAVEKKFVRARKIWSKVKNLSLPNLLIICGEAHNATTGYFNDNMAGEVFINFPDPWPKNRHAKNRLIQPSFAQEIWRILQEGSLFTFVTDDVPYSNWLIHVMGSHPGFVSSYPDPFYAIEQPNYGSSYFDELWRAKGREIRYHQFRKIKI